MNVPISIVDVETTGLIPNRDRILEIAIVRMTPDGHIEDEFVSLVNPRRDVGPTSIHGIEASDIRDAPSFEDLAPSLLERLDGTVGIAGHNVRFDIGFLYGELNRISVEMPEVPRICTMTLSGGGTLTRCCEDFGVSYEGTAHSALDDARATALLLAELERRNRIWKWTEPIRWTRRPGNECRPLTRRETHERRTTNQYLSRLTELCQRVDASEDDPAILAYHALLDRALEDRLIETAEVESLLSLAREWGLTRDQVTRVHNDYIRHLCVAALLDGIVTEAERRDLALVSRLLGITLETTDALLLAASNRLAAVKVQLHHVTSDLAGKSVCLTGELRATRKGQPITREDAHVLASAAGLKISTSVTKKLDVLVVADPATQSGKAQKARDYGIRILAEDVFWKLIGADVD